MHIVNMGVICGEQHCFMYFLLEESGLRLERAPARAINSPSYVFINLVFPQLWLLLFTEIKRQSDVKVILLSQ